MILTRHFVDIGQRRVHYRKAGQGPTLLMVHQSPRSSAEYEPLMVRWGEHFTCIAPDTPGFGQSDPLPGSPDIGDFAEALVEFMDAIGLDTTAAYGFHSGGIILVSALKRHPERFTALATGGYAVWTPEEMAIFDKDYLPPFQPSAYGEHLSWLWNRILEQTWFFPWFDVRHQARIPSAHDDPVRTDAVVRDMLDSGDAYRAGYGAVLRAPRDLPPPEAESPPVLIAAYDGDPLQAHLARLGELPKNWQAETVRTPADLEDRCLAHLLGQTNAPYPGLRESDRGGFVQVSVAGFIGLIHWKGDRTAERILIHAPGGSAELHDGGDLLAFDLPGHGLSDSWEAGFTPSLTDWTAVAAAAAAAISQASRPLILGEGASAILAAAIAADGGGSWGAIAAHIPLAQDSARWVEKGLPDNSPDRFGSYLNAGWSCARARHFFWPWFDAKAANAIPFSPEDVRPEALALEHRSLIRARSGRQLLSTLLGAERDRIAARAGTPALWETADWAASRTDIWKPAN